MSGCPSSSRPPRNKETSWLGRLPSCSEVLFYCRQRTNKELWYHKMPHRCSLCPPKLARLLLFEKNKLRCWHCFLFFLFPQKLINFKFTGRRQLWLLVKKIIFFVNIVNQSTSFLNHKEQFAKSKDKKSSIDSILLWQFGWEFKLKK